MLLDAWVICLACGGEHEIVSFEEHDGVQYDYCPFCQDRLPHEFVGGEEDSDIDIDEDLGIMREEDSPPAN
jgi:hypothetical protein